MSGAAGLSAAKRRRGTQPSTISHGVVEEQIDVNESARLPVHPLHQLQIHEHKLNGLLSHIQALGAAFVEHRTEVSLAIPQLQEAVEELLRAAQMPLLSENEVMEQDEEEADNIVDEDNQDDNTQRLMMSMTKDLSDRLTEEAEAKSRLEVKLEQVARAHADTQARLSGTEAEIKQLKLQLAESRKKSRKDNAVQNEPTFPNKSDADIVKEALEKASEGNVTLQTIEEEA